MLRSLILAFLTVSVSALYGQPVWHKGSVVLASDKVLAGELINHPEFNTIVFKSDSETFVLPAHKLKSFRYYEKASHVNRQFIIINTSDQADQSFYEVVVQGDWKVVRKLKRIHSQIPDDKMDYSYFIISHEKLLPIRHFRKTIFPELLDLRPDLYDWLKKEKLNLNEPQTAILVVRHFNRSNATELVASR
jgi:hypothetical protein